MCMPCIFTSAYTIQDGLGVLHIAAQKGCAEIVEQLINAGAEVDAVQKVRIDHS